MQSIPSHLECAYCIRNCTHGGECNRNKSYYDGNGCLAFKLDEKGCIRNCDLTISIPLYHDIPLLNVWNDNWQINGVDTEIRLTKIYGLKWDAKKGYLIVYCNIDYYVNEFHDKYIEHKRKPNLKIVK